LTTAGSGARITHPALVGLRYLQQAGLIVNGNKGPCTLKWLNISSNTSVMWRETTAETTSLQWEMPYDVPSQGDFNHDGASGYASYKVASTVTSHEAWGLGIYAYFNKAAIKVDNAIEGPTGGAMKIHHAVIISLGGNQGQITHVVNGNRRHCQQRKHQIGYRSVSLAAGMASVVFFARAGPT